MNKWIYQNNIKIQTWVWKKCFVVSKESQWFKLDGWHHLITFLFFSFRLVSAFSKLKTHSTIRDYLHKATKCYKIKYKSGSSSNLIFYPHIVLCVFFSFTFNFHLLCYVFTDKFFFPSHLTINAICVIWVVSIFCFLSFSLSSQHQKSIIDLCWFYCIFSIIHSNAQYQIRS